MTAIDKNISAIPTACNASILSPSMKRAHITATGSSTVIKIELMFAPIFGMPTENGKAERIRQKGRTKIEVCRNLSEPDN